MNKRNFLEVGRYDTSTFQFFLVFWDTLIPMIYRSIGQLMNGRVRLCPPWVHFSLNMDSGPHLGEAAR